MLVERMGLVLLLLLSENVLAQNQIEEKNVQEETQEDPKEDLGEPNGLELRLARELTSNVNQLSFGSDDFTFDSEKKTGLTNLEFRYSRAFERVRFSAGIDYAIISPVSGSGSAPDSWSSASPEATDQKFEMFGIKAAEVGYAFPMGPLTLVPGGGLGLYIGKNSVDVYDEDFASTNSITFIKGFMMPSVGGDAVYQPISNFSIRAGLFLGMPMEINSGLDQEGDWSYTNLDDELSENLDFYSDLSTQLRIGAGWHF